MQNYFDTFCSNGGSNSYKGEYLTGLDFPVGPVGGSVIRMNGKAERVWWQIFGNFEERPGSGIVPNSFFAVRVAQDDFVNVRALQTSPVGPFAAMEDLEFKGEYPFGWYSFVDHALPASIAMEVYNPLIPMDLKSSSIPCAIFNITIKNPTDKTIDVSILASQQNAVGFNGYSIIGGLCSRSYTGYQNNHNEICRSAGHTGIKMTGNNGSLHLSALDTGVAGSASWDSLAKLYDDFIANGSILGPVSSPGTSDGITVDGALAKAYSLPAGGERTLTFVLSWHLHGVVSGRSDISEWSGFEGNNYENWWSDAQSVDSYVRANLEFLNNTTRLYHDTLYASRIPRYALDRISSNLCVLRSPTAFWAKNGYFGLWESTSSGELWYGNCKHVYHYAQSYARLFPELARKLREQDLETQTPDGLLPSRTGEHLCALDGHLGTILSIYREYLLSEHVGWLNMVWSRTKKAMDYVVSEFDSDEDGMITGAYSNTLDCTTSGTNPWAGSLYLAALKACAEMADIHGDIASKEQYQSIFNTGIAIQNENLWSDELNYYVEKAENLPNTFHISDGCSIDMLLGQWWANQLNLGQIYPKDRTKVALGEIFKRNRIDDSDEYHNNFRDFLGKGDTGWMMIKFPGCTPEKPVLYYDEVMSGFEYAAASTMLQYGMVEEGLTIINHIAKRYDGRHRGCNEVTCDENATVFGSGSPFGEDECGDYYGRAMSSWSVLLALQGFIYDGSQHTIGFKPVWMPEDHVSFFSAASGWGLFTQTRRDNRQISMIGVRFGKVEVKTIILQAPSSELVKNVSVIIHGEEMLEFSLVQTGDVLEIDLVKVYSVSDGDAITISCEFAKCELASLQR